FERIPMKEWEKFLAGNAQYKAYKMQAKSEAVMTGLKAVGTTVAITASVPTFGGTIAFGIYGALTTGAEAAKQVRDALGEADDIAKRIVKHLQSLKKEFDEADKKIDEVKAKAKLTGEVVANTLLNYPVFPTIKTLRDDYELAVKKTDGLDRKHVA